MLSAVTKFPDYWHTAIAWFGISDYGYEEELGWYFTTTEDRRQMLRAAIGDPGHAGNKALYASRCSNLAAGNCRRAHVHLFVEEDEKICPLSQSLRFEDAARAAGLSSVRLHVGRDGDWRHGYPEWEVLRRAHAIVWPDGNPEDRPSGISPSESTWKVLGYLVLKDLRCRLGQGADAVATLRRSTAGNEARVEVTFDTPPTTFQIELDVSGDNGPREVVANGVVIATVLPQEGVVRLPVLTGDQEIVVRDAVADPIGLRRDGGENGHP